MAYPIILCNFVADFIEALKMSMNRIKEILELKHVSQTELAEMLGKSFNMVNLYATNKIQPPLPVLYEIANILKVDVRELLVPNVIDNTQQQ